MSTSLSEPTRPRAGAGVRTLFAVAMVVTVCSVLMGSLVCATDSSAACPNWPGCYVGQITPKARLNPVIEFVHRVVAVSCGPLLLACGIVGFTVLRGWRRVLPWIAVAGALAAGVFGMLTIKHGISTTQAAIDLGCSLIAVVAITRAYELVRTGASKDHPGVLPLVTLGVTLVYHVLSVFVAGKGSLTRCLSWPVWRLLPVDGAAAPQIARLVLGGAAALLIIATAAWAMSRKSLRARGIALLAGAVLVAVMTPLLAVGSPSLTVKAVAAVAAGLVWWLLARVACAADRAS